MKGALCKVVSSSTGLSLQNRPRFRLTLECGHTVSRSKLAPEIRCEECRILHTNSVSRP